MLQIAEFRESCRSVYKAVNKFGLNLQDELPNYYAKFVAEYVLQISLALVECHRLGLHHCNLQLDYVVVQKQKDSHSNEHGFNHMFKLTYFAPWIEEMFPASISDHQLLRILDTRKHVLTQSDIQDVLRVKDLYNFGQTILELLLGRTSRKYTMDSTSAEYYQAYSQEEITELWHQRPELAGFIEILNSCF